MYQKFQISELFQVFKIMDLIPVEGNVGLFRDENSKAVLNCSDSEYQKYLELKEHRLKEWQRLDKMDKKINEIEDLKNELSELKSIMKDLVSHLQSNS